MSMLYWDRAYADAMEAEERDREHFRFRMRHLMLGQMVALAQLQYLKTDGSVQLASNYTSTQSLGVVTKGEIDLVLASLQVDTST